jgi:hypothetical protein
LHDLDRQKADRAKVRRKTGAFGVAPQSIIYVDEGSVSKKALYVHIGIGKTGTTALQEFFWSNRKELARAGICYPKLGVRAGAHHLLSPHVPPFLSNVWDFIDVGQWAPRIASVQRDKILVSSELMAWAAEDVARAFCAKLKEWFDVRVVIYLRRQDNLIMAGYNQQIKAGTQKRDIRAVVQHQLHRFDYERKLRPWSAEVGAANMIVRPYEREQFHAGDIRNDFMHRVFGFDIDDGYRCAERNSNPRLSLSAMEYKRLINNLIPDAAKSCQFNETLLWYSRLVDRTADKMFSGQSILSPEERLEILRKYEPANQMIARKYMGRRDGKLFYEPIPTNGQEWAERTITDEELAAISQFILEHSPRLLTVVRNSIVTAQASDDSNRKEIAMRLARSLNSVRQA